MSDANTTNAPATKRGEDVSHVPFLGEEIAALFKRDELFAGLEPAFAWFKLYADLVLLEQAKEAVGNLLSATSIERRNRGVLILERSILAQATWIQMHPTMYAFYRIDRLKELTANIRNADATMSDHNTAKEAALSMQIELAELKVEIDGIIGPIQVHLADEAFMEFIKDSLNDSRPNIKDRAWRGKLLQAVRDGKAYTKSPRALQGLARHLDTLHQRKQWVDQIKALAEEQVFIFAAREGTIMSRQGHPMGLFPPLPSVLDAVLAGRGAHMSNDKLEQTAKRLDLLSRVFFDEGPQSSTGGSKSGKPKGKSDSKVKAKQRGIEEAARREANRNSKK